MMWPTPGPAIVGMVLGMNCSLAALSEFPRWPQSKSHVGSSHPKLLGSDGLLIRWPQVRILPGALDLVTRIHTARVSCENAVSTLDIDPDRVQAHLL